MMMVAIIAGDCKVTALVDHLSSPLPLPLTTADMRYVRGNRCAIKAIDDNTRRRVVGAQVVLELQVSGCWFGLYGPDRSRHPASDRGGVLASCEVS
jgi:hypothetical protein